jgi:hypothetical protein
MDAILMLSYPKEDLDEVSRLVRENDSFAALIAGDLYGLHHYLLPSELSNFTAILDRNVYTRVTALVRARQIPNHALEDHRWAAAVIAFCQIAKIKFQYGSSLQEYASVKGGESAVSDFECFYRADNCDPKAWIDFAVGRTTSLDLSSVADLPPVESPPSPEKLGAPIYEFRINYIFALKIALLSEELSLPPEQAVIRFIDWMDEEFIVGSAALQFVNLLFSPARIKGMLKKKTLHDIRNIAWDFALIQNWRRCALKANAIKEPVLLISRDKVVKFIARRLMASDLDEFRGFVIDRWNPATTKGEVIFERYMRLHEKIQVYSMDRRRPSDDELDAMTVELEHTLTNPISRGKSSQAATG